MESKTLTVSIYSPDTVIFDGQALQVGFPSRVAPFTVLPQHAPTIASLGPGEVSWRDADGKRGSLLIKSGIAKIEGDVVKACVVPQGSPRRRKDD